MAAVEATGVSTTTQAYESQVAIRQFDPSKIPTIHNGTYVGLSLGCMLPFMDGCRRRAREWFLAESTDSLGREHLDWDSG